MPIFSCKSFSINWSSVNYNKHLPMLNAIWQFEVVGVWRIIFLPRRRDVTRGDKQSICSQNGTNIWSSEQHMGFGLGQGHISAGLVLAFFLWKCVRSPTTFPFLGPLPLRYSRSKNVRSRSMIPLADVTSCKMKKRKQLVLAYLLKSAIDKLRCHNSSSPSPSPERLPYWTVGREGGVGWGLLLIQV